MGCPENLRRDLGGHPRNDIHEREHPPANKTMDREGVKSRRRPKQLLKTSDLGKTSEPLIPDWSGPDVGGMALSGTEGKRLTASAAPLSHAGGPPMSTSPLK